MTIPEKKPHGYWTDETILLELRAIISEINHFPMGQDLRAMGKGGMEAAIYTHGGISKFRRILNFPIIQQKAVYWTDETILDELKKIIQQIGHFPSELELRRQKRGGLEHALHKYGGMLKFRKILGYELKEKAPGYWSDETIIGELKELISTLGHFPTHLELYNNGHCDISSAIRKYGNTNKYRVLLGYKKTRELIASWTEERIILELKQLITELGHFPMMSEFEESDKISLILAIRGNGGINKFRRLVAQPILHQSEGYWCEATIIQELKPIESKLGHFPSQYELSNMGKSGLNAAMYKNGGINKYRELLGYTASLYEKHRSSLASYNNKRGHKSEKFVKQIITEWAIKSKVAIPDLNTKLSKGNVLEFVCNINKRIGVDVTNTGLREAVYRKWKRKDYYKYLDEFWVVVFSDSFTEKDYQWWNEISPENVKVMSISDFLHELDYSADETTRNKIEKLEKCTFHTKEALMSKTYASLNIS